jgi:glycosyltransferase involved in cell wall biosynthesis
MMTVCEGIGHQYTKDTGVKPVVLTNAPDYEKIEPNIKTNGLKRIRLIHHGGASPSRKIENMIKMMRHLDDRFEFDILLVPGSISYIEKLKKLACDNPRIHFLSPVPMQQLVKFSNKYDIGVYLLAPSNFNTQHALPNKFFEFIQARLALAIGPSPEMAKIVKEYDCGVVARDFDPKSLANCLLRLDNTKINHYKCQSHKIARKMSAEQNRETLLNLIDQTLA